MSFFACFTELLSAGFNATLDNGVRGGKTIPKRNLTLSAKWRKRRSSRTYPNAAVAASSVAAEMRRFSAQNSEGELELRSREDHS